VTEEGLKSVKVDTWGPFIFVNLDPHCGSLQAQLGELPELFKRYELSNWARVHSVDYWEDINWKLYVENNAESYHEPSVHPSLAKYYQRTTAEARHYYYLQRSPVSLDDNQELTRQDPALSAPGLSQDELEWASIMSFFPNFAWILTPACAIIYLIDPQAVQKTRIRWDWLVPNTEAAKSRENLDALTDVFDSIQWEDLKLLREVQKRIRSMGYRQGRLSPTREVGTHLFQELVMQALSKQ
jgi:phenylpropionate dioxygenase-like ring-hydroxylating dioxygenase large terminal subunit